MDGMNSRITGRRPLGGLKRRHKVTVAFNDAEMTRLDMNLGGSGIPVSTFCRKAALGVRIPPALSAEDRACLRSLSNIGNNLNQLVHMMHVSGVRCRMDEIDGIIARFREEQDYFRRRVSHGR